MNKWAMGRPGPLRVYSPPGVERVVADFEEGMRSIRSTGSRITAASSCPKRTGASIRSRSPDLPTAVGPPSCSRRTDSAPLVRRDTKKDAGLIAAAKGADVLFHEAQANHLVARIGEAATKAGRPRVAKITHDIPSYHTTPVQAAEVANEAGVKLLVLYHLTPSPPLRIVEWVFTRGVPEIRPDGWLLADDGLLVELPVDSSDITTRWIH
jgi:ribonuclease Z